MPGHPDQGSARPSGGRCELQKRRQLGWLVQYGAHDPNQGNASVPIKRDQRRRRQIPVSRIRDCPERDEGQSVRLGDACDSAALQVDGMGSRGGKQKPLGSRIRRDFGAREKAMPGAAAEASGEGQVGRVADAACQDRRWDDQGSRLQCRVQPAGEAEADQCLRPLPDQFAGCLGRTVRRAAAGKHLVAKAGRDARLGRQTGYKAEFVNRQTGACQDWTGDPRSCTARKGRDGQNPTSTRLVLPRLRLRYRAIARSGKYSLYPW